MAYGEANRFGERARKWLWAALGLLFLTGCSTSEVADAPAGADAATAAASLSAEGETWDLLRVQGARVGYVHTQIRQFEEDGQPRVEIEADQRMTVKRFDDLSQPGIHLKSVETPDGRLVRFESRQELGPQPEVATGRVEGSQLIVRTSTTGKITNSRIAWKPEMGGFFCVEQSLLRQPMQPGQKRSLQGLAPMFHQPFDYELSAKEKETTPMLDGSLELLRIEVVTTLPGGQTLQSTIWTDDRGQTLKTYTADLKQETLRVTREAALDNSSAAPFDLGETTIVKLAKPLKNVHQAREVRYRVTLAASEHSDARHSDPAKVFVSGPTQTVRPVGDNIAEVTVKSLRGQGPVAAPPLPDKPPTDGDRQPNNMIQSDDPRIVAMAAEAAGDEKDPRQVAVALERYVRKSIKEINFSQALATAADVAQSRQGDCTEHAVLLAALGRARDIPSRVAIGLVYVEGYQGFGYHMWTEMYLDGQWVPFDATLGQGGIGGGHLKLSHSDLAAGDAYSSFLPVARVMGRLKIEVLE